jgi:putative hemolysin
VVEIIVIVICLALNAILAAYEMAFVSFSKIELSKIAKLGSKSADILLKRRENPERTLSVIQIGISLVGAMAAAVGGAGADEILEPYLISKWGLNSYLAEGIAILIVVLPLTYFTVVFGELVPKTLALRHSSKIVLYGTRWLIIADRVLGPAISALEWSTKAIVRLLFPASKKHIVSTEALVEIGDLSPTHQQYVLNLARIEYIRIEDMMVKWEEVDRVNESNSMDQVVLKIFSSGHTRLPVIDAQNKVIGILHTKELLAFRDSGAQDWKPMIRQPLLVQGKNSALGALRLMQTSKSHMVMVCSEKGVMQGILTLEDILEEIVGDIFDEDDDGRVQKLIANRARSAKLRKHFPQ